MTFHLLSFLFWGAILAGASALAIRRPATAVRVAKGVLAALALVWVLACGLGIVVQELRRGAGLEGWSRQTSFDVPHAVFGHIAVVLVGVAFCVCVPLAIERAARRDGVGRLVLHLTLAFATSALVLLTSFSGYFGRPPRTDGSMFRFAILHLMVLPAMGTLALLGWLLVVRRYRLRGA